MPGVLEQYRDLLSQGKLKPDSAQALAVEKLASLAKALTAYLPEQGEQGWLSRFGFGSRSPRALQWRPGDAESDHGRDKRWKRAMQRRRLQGRSRLVGSTRCL